MTLDQAREALERAAVEYEAAEDGDGEGFWWAALVALQGAARTYARAKRDQPTKETA